MSESELGVSVAATRQKGGRVLKMFGVCLGPVMGSAPASTVWASVIAVFGGRSEDRSAQLAASADCAMKTRSGSFITRLLTSSPLDSQASRAEALIYPFTGLSAKSYPKPDHGKDQFPSHH